MKDRNNECFKWALRAAFFPPKKDPKKSSKYPVNDDINCKGIDFQIDKLEEQNRNLAINVLCVIRNCVIVHMCRICRKEARVPRINLMLIETGKFSSIVP